MAPPTPVRCPAYSPPPAAARPPPFLRERGGSGVCGRSGRLACSERPLTAESGRRRRPAMLRGLGSWLGLERAGEEKLLPAEERSSPVEEEEEEAAADAEAAVRTSEQAELQADSEALLSQAKGLGSECPVLPCPSRTHRRRGPFVRGRGLSERGASVLERCVAPRRPHAGSAAVGRVLKEKKKNHKNKNVVLAVKLPACGERVARGGNWRREGRPD